MQVYLAHDIIKRLRVVKHLIIQVIERLDGSSSRIMEVRTKGTWNS